MGVGCVSTCCRLSHLGDSLPGTRRLWRSCPCPPGICPGAPLSEPVAQDTVETLSEEVITSPGRPRVSACLLSAKRAFKSFAFIPLGNFHTCMHVILS